MQVAAVEHLRPAVLPKMSAREDEAIMPAHTPKCLEQLAVEQLVCMIIQNSIPSSLQSPRNELLPLQDGIWIPYNHWKLDELIMIDDIQLKHPTEKTLFLEQLQELKHWWEDNEWFGKQKSEIRQQIKECFTRKLELVDPYCKFPVFRLLLQLIFSTRVDFSNDNPKVRLELHLKYCPVLSDVLRSLRPFGIEELSTRRFIFGDPEPWIIIIENSPFLRKVHFRNNICTEILLSVGQHCPLIDTIIVEQLFGRLMVPVDCFYKTFFHGLDYETLYSILKSDNSLNKQKYISFPRLKSVDLGGNNGSRKVNKHSLTEFLYNLLFFYPDVVCVSCYTLQPFFPRIPSTLPEHCSSLSYSIKHVYLEGLIPWVHYHLSKSSECSNEGIDFESVVSSFRQLQHITICHCLNSHPSVENIKESANFLKIWFPKFKCKYLTIHIPFTPFQESNHGILSLYTSLFSSIGHSLCALHFHIHVNIDISEVCQLISLCPNLELLEIRVHGDVSMSSDEYLHIQRLPNLKSLSVESGASLGASIINTLVEKIIVASPVLSNLELMLAHKHHEWLMGLAVDKIIAKIRTLRISNFVHCSIEWREYLQVDDVVVSFYVPLVEMLPSLEVLMLDKLPVYEFKHIRSIYHTSNIKVVARSTPYIGYTVLNSNVQVG